MTHIIFATSTIITAILLGLFAKPSIAVSAENDITITNTHNAQVTMSYDNQTLNILTGGSIEITTLLEKYGITTSSKPSNLTINVDTQDQSKGIITEEFTDSVVNLGNTSGNLNVNVTSGIITSLNTYHQTSRILDLGQRSGNSFINVGSQGIISQGDPTIYGSAIYNKGTGNITITNSGKISSTNNTVNNNINYFNEEHAIDGSAAIAHHGSGILTVNNENGGEISGGSGRAIMIVNNDAKAIINNKNGATINGHIGSVGSELELTNSGTINGNIASYSLEVSPTEFATSDKLTLVNNGIIHGNIEMGSHNNSSFTMNAGSVTGNLNSSRSSQAITMNAGSFNGDISFAGALNLGNINTINGNISAIQDSTTSQHAANLNIHSSAKTVTGTLNLNSGDSLSVTFGSNGSVGKITSNGITTIASGTKLNINTGGNTYSYIKDGSKYTIVQGSSGSNISKIVDENINVNGNNSNAFSILTFTTTAQDNQLMVNAKRAAGEEVASNINNLQTYTAVNNIGTGLTGSLSQAMGSMERSGSKSQINQTLSSLNPVDDSSVQTSGISSVKESAKVIENRLEEVRSYDNPYTKGRSKNIDYILKKGKEFTKEGLSSGDGMENIEVWAQGYGTTAKQKNTNDNGSRTKFVGFAFGADKKINKTTRIGASVSYSQSNVTSSDHEKINDFDSYQFNLYGTKSYNQYFVDSIVGATLNEHQSTRVISAASAVARAKYRSQSYLARLRLGKTYSQVMNSKFIIIPEISTTFINTHTDSYKEDGADTANLHVRANSNEYLEGRIGININHEAIGNKYLFTPRSHASYGYNFLNNNQITVANFIGQSSTFSNVSTAIDPKSIRLGLGLDVNNHSNTTISLDYVNEMRKNYVSHSGSVKATVAF